MSSAEHVTVVGAGIVGLAVARAFALKGLRVTVLEKEPGIASHQTGRNSGVIHSGPYYKPGSLKAQLCVSGGRALKAYARERGLDHNICGKLIVASKDEHRARVDEIYRRAKVNGVTGEVVSGTRLKELEPNCLANYGLFIEGTGIIDYVQVARNFGKEIEELGGSLKLSSPVTSVLNRQSKVIVEHGTGTEVSDYFVNAAGLHSDHIARLSGINPSVKIVPFKGQYFVLDKRKSGLVRGMVYPAPDPAMPFLGVHITTSIDGALHVGPNAILAMGREGYGNWDVDLRHLSDMMLFPGLWRFLAANRTYALNEGLRIASKRRFVRELGMLIEGVEVDDLTPTASGIRAQAMDANGGLVDDFVIERNGRQIHVLNAPSPAATASMSIADWIVHKTLID